MRVIVVGAGVIGCSAAFALARRGADVTVVERGVAGSGASGAAAGMLAPLSESDAPGEFVDLCMAALHEFEPWIESVERLAQMRVDLVRSGVLMLASRPEQERDLQARLPWQRDCDPRVEYLDGTSLKRLAPHLDPGFLGAMHYPGEVQVDARRYSLALGRAAVAAGARLLEGAEVTAIAIESGRAAGVEIAGERLAADAVLVACGSDASLLQQAGAHLPLAPNKGELLRLVPAAPLVGPIIFAPGGYLTPKADGSVVVGATQAQGRHDVVVGAGSVATLLEFAFGVVPALREARFVEAWAGLRPTLPDHVPAVGRVPELDALWVAAGHHRNGILLAGWTGEHLAAAMLEGAALPGVVAPGRFKAAVGR